MCTHIYTHTHKHTYMGFSVSLRRTQCHSQQGPCPGAARLERGGAGSESTFSSRKGGATRPPQGQHCSGPRESESRSVVSAERPQSSTPSADPQAHSTGVCSSPPQPHGSLLQGLSLDAAEGSLLPARPWLWGVPFPYELRGNPLSVSCLTQGPPPPRLPGDPAEPVRLLSLS